MSDLKQLCTSQKLLAATMMAKISEETKNNFEKTDDQDMKKALSYVLSKFDKINKEIAEEILIETTERIKKLREVILDD